jgi:hypothetical protein
MSVGDPCHTPTVSDYVETPGGPAQHPSQIQASVFACGYLCSYHVARLKTEVYFLSRPMPDGEAVFIRPTHLS